MPYSVLLSAGPPTAIIQNQVYALPAKSVKVHSLAALEISPDGATFDALTGSDTVGAETGSGFIRCTTGNTTVVVKMIG